MAWYNNGLDMQNLAGSTSATSQMLALGTMPEGFVSGLTILRLIGRVTVAAQAAINVVNALFAFYVATRPSLTTPPNLNADFLDYYLFGGIQIPQTGGEEHVLTIPFDIRTARRVRGEDRGLFFRITNNEVTGLQFGVEARFLLMKS